MADRANARAILTVHKAAHGSTRHAQAAAAAVSAAAECLDGHHGSSSGLVDAECMAPPPSSKGKGKSKGKGMESFANKTARLEAEITDAAALHDPQLLEYLWKVQDGHLKSAWRYYDDNKEPKGKGKGTGKGKGKGIGPTQTESAKVHALRKEIQELKQAQSSSSDSNDTSTDDSTANGHRSRSGSARRSRSRTNDGHARGEPRARQGSRRRSTSRKRSKSAQSSQSSGDWHQTLTKEEKAERKKLKKERDALRKQQKREGTEAAPRETRLCCHADCTSNRTYATSTRCIDCGKPFPTGPIQRAPTTPTPTPTPTVPPAVVSPASDQARLTLKQLGSAAQARAVTYAEATKKAVTVVAPTDKQPLPTPPQPPKPTPVVIALDSADSASAETAAKELAAIRTKLAALDAQGKEWISVPALAAAIRAEAAALTVKMEAILAKHQASLAPQQLEEILSQRRLELTAAVKTEAAAVEATQTRVAAFDEHAHQVNNDYVKEVAALNNAHVAAQKALDAERVDLIATLHQSANTAKAAVVAIRARIAAAQALVQAATPADTAMPDAQAVARAAAEAEAKAAADKAAADQAAAVVTAKQALIDDLHRQLELAKQQLAVAANPAPTPIPPTPQARTVPTLPQVQLTTDEALAQTWYVVRAGLLLLDVQDTALDVHWQELFSAGLLWPRFCELIPASIVATSEPLTDPTTGPDPAAKVPRRILGLLRAQLDALASLWTVSHAKNATAAEVTNLANDFITKVRQEALRNQKRPATRPSDSTAGPAPAAVATAGSAPAAAPGAADPPGDAAPAPKLARASTDTADNEVAATQIDAPAVPAATTTPSTNNDADITPGQHTQLTQPEAL